ncbi:NADH:flavin oxidoreductase [Ensifer sp. SSB1]|uniref:NADH:flavin oxidoreductase n=1 Tax=Ensifer sp. SSB1 TaxID=2795385 RepID=UPI001A5DD55B|nr:NADH:flavin oxidoreductase [Ensifer sp. SSB1]MBK5571099.1 NADH:flavin oxidoreductase [Ensifer sp. SSB1]
MSETLRDNSVHRKTDAVLSEFKLGHITFRNRIMSTSHACGLEIDGMPGEAYARYHEEKAKGGLALTMFGGSSNIDLDSPSNFRQLNVGTDRVIPYLQKLSKAVHRHGAYTMCQITHLGRRGDPYAGDWLPTIGPSAIRETLHRSIPKEMDENDIVRVVKAYGAAARRCLEGGLDGIETLASGHLIGQFLSPLMNKRTDRYGGSLENRSRFALMVHEAIREATVSERFLVGMRLTVDEAAEGGLDADECIRFGEILKREGAVDFFDAIFGATDTVRAMAVQHMPGIGTPIAPWIEQVGSFKNAVGLPVFHATRVTDLASARYAIAAGKVDMVGMTRAQIADPHLVNKLVEGREEEIRPCVGGTHCQSSYRPACLHNPATGRELTLDHVQSLASEKRKIVVVGGGPAGLEAARICAERGHHVSLYEAASEVGGQVLLASRGTWRRDLMGIIEWRVSELGRLGVVVQTNAFMGTSDITELNPDAVILATGGMPMIDLTEGQDLCVTPWDVLAGQVALSGRVVVADGTGRHGAPLVAEAAKLAGCDVTYVSIDAALGEDLVYADKYRWRKQFDEFAIRPIGETRVTSVRRLNNQLVANLFSDLTYRSYEIAADHVVIEQGTLPFDELYTDLKPLSSNDGVIDLRTFVEGKKQLPKGKGAFELYRIGDAVSSRNIQASILDAVRLCNKI